MGLRIHHGIEARTSLQERAIADHPGDFIDSRRERGWPLKPIPNAALERRVTQTADLRQLAHAVAFDDPLRKPEVPVRRRMTPDKRPVTVQTIPALMRSRRVSGTFCPQGATVNAGLFWSPQSTRWILFPRTPFQRTTYSKISNTF